MKRIGIGFTAIIAILAMSFTFASKSGKVAKADLLDGCYTTLQIHELPLASPPVTRIYSDVSNAPSYNGVETISTTAGNFPAFLKNSANYTLLTASGKFGELVGDPQAECPIAEVQPVCCYQVENNKIVWIRFGEYTPQAE